MLQNDFMYEIIHQAYAVKVKVARLKEEITVNNLEK